MEAYICDGVRTPIGRYGGSLSSIRTDDLAALPIAALMTRNAGVDWAKVDEVILGSANQAGEDNRNVARMAVLLAGLGEAVPVVDILEPVPAEGGGEVADCLDGLPGEGVERADPEPGDRETLGGPLEREGWIVEDQVVPAGAGEDVVLPAGSDGAGVVVEQADNVATGVV